MNSFMQTADFLQSPVGSYSLRELFLSGCAGKRISGVRDAMPLPLSVQVWSAKSNVVGCGYLKMMKITQKDRHKYVLLRDEIGGKGKNRRQKINNRQWKTSVLRDKGKSNYLNHWNFSLLFGIFVSGETLVLKFCQFIW